MSGTTGQVHGAAYGPGVYLSPHASTSIGYAKMMAPSSSHTLHSSSSSGGGGGRQSTVGSTEQAPRFIDPQNLRVMALCEVVKSSHLKKHNAQIWTHTNHDEVVTRMLFVYENGTVKGTNRWSNIVTTDAATSVRIRSIIGND